MSLYDYRYAQRLEQEDPPFYGLVMALVRKADTYNTETLKRAWPEVFEEYVERYNAPGGMIQGEQSDPEWRPQISKGEKVLAGLLGEMTANRDLLASRLKELSDSFHEKMHHGAADVETCSHAPCCAAKEALRAFA